MAATLTPRTRALPRTTQATLLPSLQSPVESNEEAAVTAGTFSTCCCCCCSVGGSESNASRPTNDCGSPLAVGSVVGSTFWDPGAWDAAAWILLWKKNEDGGGLVVVVVVVVVVVEEGGGEVVGLRDGQFVVVVVGLVVRSTAVLEGATGHKDDGDEEGAEEGAEDTIGCGSEKGGTVRTVGVEVVGGRFGGMCGGGTPPFPLLASLVLLICFGAMLRLWSPFLP